MRTIQRVNHIWLAWQLLRHFGAGWLLSRSIQQLKVRSGWLARVNPCQSWQTSNLEQLLDDPSIASPRAYLAYRKESGPRFFFSTEDRTSYNSLFARWDQGQQSAVTAEADRICQGEFPLFGRCWSKLGFPPDWHASPLTGGHVAAERHWSKISDFGQGDIKAIWEPSRFGWTYPLVRAYWRTGKQAYAEAFWRLVESWHTDNLPNRGANWKCGQEASLRLMAWCFGLYGFADSPSSSAGRTAMLAQMVAVTGRRIEANLPYALSQQNNHGISEGMGLWTIGLLFPELRGAARWRQTGRHVLQSLGRKLIYEDGSFSQHSFNYQRLMLHDYIWSLRLGQINDDPLSDELVNRVAKSAQLLYQVQDESSGRVPCYGQNDGAMILPLSGCDLDDFRPVVQAASVLTSGRRVYEPGPWDEDLLWLFGPQYEKFPIEQPKRTDLEAGQGGYYTIRSRQGFVFTRSAQFRHRPAQADMLHADLWWRGQNIAIDPGTYSYNAPAPWNNPLAQTAYHNTVSVDGQNQMERAGRFLWLPWLHGKSLPTQRSSGGYLSYWQGQHDGYLRLKGPVVHRRGMLRLAEDYWLVVDDLRSRTPHHYRLHWLLMDAPHTWDESGQRLTLETTVGPYNLQWGTYPLSARGTLKRGEEGSARGWQSRGYLTRRPALSLDMTVQGESVMFWTLFGPGRCRTTVNELDFVIDSDDWNATLRLCEGDEQPVIHSVKMTGAREDSLAIAP